MFWSTEGMRFVLQDASRRELSYTGRLKRRASLPVKWAPQSLRPRHLPFDLLHPPYRGLLHTFFNPLPASFPSHQINQTGCLLQRNAISSTNVGTARSLSFSNHFTQMFFFFFDAFLLSPGRKTWAGVHQSGGTCPSLLGRCLIPHVLGSLTRHVLGYSPLPFTAFFHLSISISIPTECLLRQANNDPLIICQLLAKFCNLGLVSAVHSFTYIDGL